MTLWEFRQTVESAIPLYMVLVVVVLTLVGIIGVIWSIKND